MPYVILIIAVLLAAAGGILLYLSGKENAGRRPTHPAPRWEKLAQPGPRRAEQVKEKPAAPAPEPEPEPEPLVESEPAAPTTVPAAPPEPAYEPVPEPVEKTEAGQTVEAEPEPEYQQPAAIEPLPLGIDEDDYELGIDEPLYNTQPEPANEPIPERVVEETVVDEGDEDSEPEVDEAEPVVETQPEPARKPSSKRHPLSFPAIGRRERKSWGELHGFEYMRHDDYLDDEWTRGAAAGGDKAHDIVSGIAYNHEMLLMDIGNVEVMAMRTGGGSDIVVDYRRTSADLGETSEDLVQVGPISDFMSYGSDAGVVRRLNDVRIFTALQQLPPSVTAVWMESDWVLAQSDRPQNGEVLDRMLAPMALLADAARTLPPRSEAGLTIDLSTVTPSRDMADPVKFDLNPPQRDAHEELEAVQLPPVVRPEEPLEMPSRREPMARGVVEPRPIGGDEVDAIADGTPPKHAAEDNRVLRPLSGRSSIFDDQTSIIPDDDDPHGRHSRS